MKISLLKCKKKQKETTQTTTTKKKITFTFVYFRNGFGNGFSDVFIVASTSRGVESLLFAFRKILHLADTQTTTTEFPEISQTVSPNKESYQPKTERASL